eukprot:scaffold676_cov273-Pinguiococcus_pyrenoidosus.AAC.14
MEEEANQAQEGVPLAHHNLPSLERVLAAHPVIPSADVPHFATADAATPPSSAPQLLQHRFPGA